MDARFSGIDFASLDHRRKLHIILPVFFVSVIAFLDRVNVAYAGMTMTRDLPWLTPEIFGAGAGMFFLGYFFTNDTLTILRDLLHFRFQLIQSLS